MLIEVLPSLVGTARLRVGGRQPPLLLLLLLTLCLALFPERADRGRREGEARGALQRHGGGSMGDENDSADLNFKVFQT